MASQPCEQVSAEEAAEEQLRLLLWAKMRRERGDEWMEKHASFLEAQWEWAVQLGMLDPEVHTLAFSPDSDPAPPGACSIGNAG